MSYTPEQEKLYTWHYRRLKNNLRGMNFQEFSLLLEAALKRGYPIDYYPPEGGYTILQQALLQFRQASNKKQYQEVQQIANLILDKGADSNVCDKSQWSALYVICWNYPAILDADLFERIVSQAKSVSKNDELAFSPLDILAQAYVAYRKKEEQSPEKLNTIVRAIHMLIDVGAEPERDLKPRWKTLQYVTDKKKKGLMQEAVNIINSYQEQKEQMRKTAEVVYEYEL